jgi:hypothetical protein
MEMERSRDHVRLFLARQKINFFDNFGCRHADIVLELRGLFDVQPPGAKRWKE